MTATHAPRHLRIARIADQHIADQHIADQRITDRRTSDQHATDQVAGDNLTHDEAAGDDAAEAPLPAGRPTPDGSAGSGRGDSGGG